MSARLVDLALPSPRFDMNSAVSGICSRNTSIPFGNMTGAALNCTLLSYSDMVSTPVAAIVYAYATTHEFRSENWTTLLVLYLRWCGYLVSLSAICVQWIISLHRRRAGRALEYPMVWDVWPYIFLIFGTHSFGTAQWIGTRIMYPFSFLRK